MTPISAEDSGILIDMKSRKVKILGISIVLIAFLLGSINSIFATNLSVTDTDPSTYIIVVMLMLFLLIIFSAKEDLKFEFEMKNIAYGTVIFVAYILLLSYSRVSLSFVFQSYRIDALLFSVLLTALIILVFGTDGIRKMKHVPIYALFASPILLLPILSLNSTFADLNAGFVYSILRLIGIPVTQEGLVIVAPSLTSITISTTCVSIGTFVALVMFLIPIAYLYEGKVKARALWVASGLGLILLLNVLRMLSVSLVWVYYGIGSAISLFHAVAGQLLFYASIIIMVLLAGRYGIWIERIKKSSIKEDRRKERKRHELIIPAALAIAFGFVGFVLSLQYSGAIYAPAFFFAGNSTISTQLTIENMVSSLGHAHANIVQLGATEAGELFALAQNRSNTSNVTYVIGTPIFRAVGGGMVANYSSISGTSSYILRNGVRVTGAIVRSGAYSFDVDYFALPYNYSGRYATINYEVFRQITNTSAEICSIDNYTILGISNYIESSIYNMLRLQFGAGDRAFMCYSYYIAASQQ